MKSERRDTPRISIALEAMLNHGNSGFRRCQTRDISLDGAFLETGETQFGPNALVDLALQLPGPERKQTHRFRGQIIRSTAHGVALVFDPVSTDGYAALLDLVYARQPRSSW